MALMLLCEFILNSQAAPPGEAFLFHTLLELYLADALPDENAQPSPTSSQSVRRCVQPVGSPLVLCTRTLLMNWQC